MNFNNRHKLHLDPDPDGFGGGAGGSGSPSGESAPAFDESKYAPREDFDRVVGELGEFKTKYSGLETEFGGFKEKLSGLFGEQKQDSDKEPNLSSYPKTEQGVAKYIDDRARWIASKSIQDYQTKQQTEAKTQAESASNFKIYGEHQTRITEASKRYRDYHEVTQKANASGVLTFPAGENGQPNILKDIVSSDVSGDLMYAIAKNPGEKWNILNAYQAGYGQKYIGKLEARIEAQNEARKKANKLATGVTTLVEGDTSAPGWDEEADAIAREHLRITKKG
jgi:hypothetical protein